MIQDILKALGCTVYPGPQYLWALVGLIPPWSLSLVITTSIQHCGKAPGSSQGQANTQGASYLLRPFCILLEHT
jgi:hypothetical protein